jgi:hypothetical protein
MAAPPATTAEVFKKSRRVLLLFSLMIAPFDWKSFKPEGEPSSLRSFFQAVIQL